LEDDAEDSDGREYGDDELRLRTGGLVAEVLGRTPAVRQAVVGCVAPVCGKKIH
jgi:hypothetical protein